MRSVILLQAAILSAATACSPPPTGNPAPGAAAAKRAPGRPVARLEAPILLRKKNGHYKVRRPWTVVLEGRAFHIPKGYSTNGITAPDKLKKLLGDNIDAPETWAAVFHDWLFTQKGFTRQENDRLFHELLLAYGVSPSKARLMYSFVSAYSASKAR